GSGAGAFGQGGSQGPQSAQAFQDPGSRQGGFGDGGSGTRSAGFGDGAPAAEPPQQPQKPKERGGRRRPQLPGRGGPRAELPGGDQQQRTPSWSDENAQPPVPRASLDTPRGHEEPDALSATSPMPRIDDRQGPGRAAGTPRADDRQGPASASEYPRPDFDATRPGAGSVGNSGQFVRSDIFGTPNQSGATGQYPAGRGQDTGQYPAPGRAQDPASTGQFAPQGYDGSGTGQFAAPGYGNQQNSSSTGQFERPAAGGEGYSVSRPAAPQRPQQQRRQEPEALPPAGPGDGRTPLYDTLETNWFHGDRHQSNGSAAQAPQQQQQPAAPQRPAPTAWRTSPNDELVRQAERVRQPAAGGVTTSGLPRRVPRANLVPGTAQQQQHQNGPQVSRAPDEVRGRLTNLRRGIAQGRQAGTGQTGSFPSPTHQQER
ncbi:membrane protein, partial [Streptomyces hygroscopicus]|nr:membrane protein [Streptomyces hygroscopicus]